MSIKIILASKSPRRKELFSLIGLSPEILPADTDEDIGELCAFPERAVTEIAKRKAYAAKELYKRGDNALIVSADTLVSIENRLLGKPKDEAEAFNMLKLLSGKTHEVYTGFCLLFSDKSVTNSEKTFVTFRDITDDEIISYISSKEPLDKAGAYGIQGLGSIFVKEIRGDYFNVMGFPLCSFNESLKNEFGLSVFDFR